jgi:hypothetical protein
MVFITVITVVSEAFWQDKFTAQYFGKVIQLLFGGKVRSLITSHMFFLVGAGLVFIFDPEITIIEMVSLCLVSEIFIIGTAIGVWMNLRIGPYSWAPRHKILVDRIIRFYDDDELDTLYLKTILESLIAETKNGNSVSRQLLKVRELVSTMDFNDNIIEA